jgi:hypothetical protein
MPSQEWTPRLPDGGAFFGKPQERKPGRDAGRHGPGSSRARRRQGHEGRARSFSRVNERPGRRTLEGHAILREQAREGRGGRWSGPASHDVDRTSLSPRRPSAVRAARRGSRLRRPSPSSEGDPPRRAGARRTAGPVASATASPAARERKHDRKVGHVPEDPVNPLPGLPRNERRGGKPSPWSCSAAALDFEMASASRLFL